MGSRVMQAVFLPAMAIAFATAPVAGQNVGAGDMGRVRSTFTVAATSLSGLMLLLTLFCQWQGDTLIALFSADPLVVAFGAEFLHVISYNFVASGIVFTCAGLFQALGDTMPSLIASATRIITFAIPVVWLVEQPSFEARYVWYVSVATVTLQAIVAWILLARKMQRFRPPAKPENGTGPGPRFVPPQGAE